MHHRFLSGTFAVCHLVARNYMVMSKFVCSFRPRIFLFCAVGFSHAVDFFHIVLVLIHVLDSPSQLAASRNPFVEDAEFCLVIV